MKDNDEAARERAEDLKLESEIAECYGNWRRRTVWVGIVFVADAACWLSLLFGFPTDSWSRYAHTVGTPLPLLFVAFIGVAATAWNFSEYLKNIRKIDQEYPPEDND